MLQGTPIEQRTLITSPSAVELVASRKHSVGEDSGVLLFFPVCSLCIEHEDSCGELPKISKALKSPKFVPPGECHCVPFEGEGRGGAGVVGERGGSGKSTASK